MYLQERFMKSNVLSFCEKLRFLVFKIMATCNFVICRIRDGRYWYRPCVGDSLFSVSTPFATYCPEVFHNSVMSGSVCKLIGLNGSVFLTDACHLPNTEGASLRSDRSP